MVCVRLVVCSREQILPTDYASPSAALGCNTEAEVLLLGSGMEALGLLSQADS